MKFFKYTKIFMLDVENNGVHGLPFSVAYVLKDISEKTLSEGIRTLSSLPPGTPKDTKWCQENILSHLPLGEDLPDGSSTPQGLAKFLAEAWRDANLAYPGEVVMAADVAYPVETTYLEGIRRYTPVARIFDEFPIYPLIDLAPMLYAMGEDGLGTFKRQPDELPAHNPLHDARQSARIMVEVLRFFRGETCFEF